MESMEWLGRVKSRIMSSSVSKSIVGFLIAIA